METPLAQGQGYAILAERYFARPRGEREAFAHRYADGLRKRLEAAGAIPFAAIPKTDHGAGHEGE